jgi:hypothetical protein
MKLSREKLHKNFTGHKVDLGELTFIGSVENIDYYMAEDLVRTLVITDGRIIHFIVEEDNFRRGSYLVFDRFKKLSILK